MAQHESLSHAGRRLLDRRSFLAESTSGLGAIALSSLIARQGALSAGRSPEGDGCPIRPEIDPARPHAPRSSHLPARANNVLVIFCSGACSHIDTWDYKPELVRRHEQPMPGSEKLVTFQGEQGNLIKSPYAFRPRGECGKMTSDLLPRMGELVDEMCFIHSMKKKTNTRGPGANIL